MIMKMKKILKMPLRRMPRRASAAESLRAKASANSTAYGKEDYEMEEEPNMKFSHALMVVLALHVIAVGGVFAFNSIKAGQAAAAKEEAARPPAPTTAEPKSFPPEKTAETWEGRTHTVQAGDTLSRLASLYKTSIEAIEKENGITTYSMIRVGQILKIPTPKTESTKPATDPATAAVKHAFLSTKSDLPKPPLATAKAENPKPLAVATPATAKAESPKPLAAATPPAKPLTQPVVVKKEDAPPKTADGNTYVVAKGDNPYSIAKKLHVSYNELIAINEIKDPTRVQIGQKLKIPPRKN
jgi:LysM repeat protein